MSSTRWLWLGVPFLGLLELGAHRYFATRAPAPSEWQSVRPAVQALRRHEEPVVVAPYWAEPLARNAFGADMFPVAQVARPDMTEFARAIEVSILGQHSPELAGWHTVLEQPSGRFRLRVLENPHPARVGFDFWVRLDAAQTEVSLEDAEGTHPCVYRADGGGSTGGLHGHIAFPGVRFQCPGSPQIFVGRTVLDDQDYRPRRCLWAHPPIQGTLVVRYPAVPLGPTLRGHGGLSWFLWRDGGTSPVELEIRVDGDSLGTFVHHDQQGWQAFEFSTKSHAGTTGTVEFRVRSERPDNREFCFTAQTG